MASLRRYVTVRHRVRKLGCVAPDHLGFRALRYGTERNQSPAISFEYRTECYPRLTSAEANGLLRLRRSPTLAKIRPIS
jgi:hypothetical protein